MIKILFVCHGNICRSPMAEFIMKHMVERAGLTDEIYVESAATSTEELGNDIHSGTRRKLIQMGIPFEKRHARQVTRSDCSKFDYISVMDENNMRNLKRITGDNGKERFFKLLDFTDRAGEDIADPWYTGNFDETYSDIEEGCRGMLKMLTDRLNPSYAD